MKRRHFVGLLGCASGAALLGAHAPGWAQAVAQRARAADDRILILVELKGGNDGLNTVVPYSDALYYQLRPALAIKAEEVLRLDARIGLHPALKALLPLVEKGELAVVQGVGYPQPNLSHFRSIEIWATASNANQYLEDGWVTRALNVNRPRAQSATDGVVIGGNEFGPLIGARAVTMSNVDAFVSQAAPAAPAVGASNPALEHILRVENDVSNAAALLKGEKFAFKTQFPQTKFGNVVRAAAQVIGVQRGKQTIPVLTLSLGTFDTHQRQAGLHAGLLRDLADGLYALRAALLEVGAWERTTVMTFSEFGRRPRQNESAGTDHGTAAPHFVTGGAVRGGIYGQPPDLSRLDSSQNVAHTIDFRQLYTTIAQRWWGVDADKVVRGRFEPVNFLRT